MYELENEGRPAAPAVMLLNEPETRCRPAAPALTARCTRTRTTRRSQQSALVVRDENENEDEAEALSQTTTAEWTRGTPATKPFVMKSRLNFFILAP